MGCDDYTTLGKLETGARAALPIWVAFMQNALEHQPHEYFDVPDNTVYVPIDPDTGQPTPDHQKGVTALFLKTNRPKSR
ncbi:MAG: hypothetical protein R2874_07290 [Desulfobacterales bacterium]